KTFGSWSYSEALSDLRAISVLPMGDGEVRVAFPFEWYVDSEWGWYDSKTGLQQITLTGLDGNSPRLIDEGVLDVTNEEAYSWQSRGVIHNDAVFLTSNNGFWAAPWHAPELASDAVLGLPFECAENAVPGLEIMVKLPLVSVDNAC